MKYDYFNAIEARRSMYAISKESAVSDQRLKEIIEHSIKHTPSAFNSQSGRVILLLGKEHDLLWDITRKELKKVIPEDRFEETGNKIASFQNGYGTILYFEDYEVVEALQRDYPLYKDNFPLWSYQSSGMLQYNIWVSLSIEGLGASLQHYNEVIEEKMKERWSIPANWNLIGQMPFGRPTGEAGEKEYEEMSKRFLVYGE
jgi:predicted oxidoreductase (fatty acid repression mutant protein)